MVISFSSATSSALARGFDGEVLTILAQGWRLQFFHAAAATVEEQAELVVGMEDAGGLIDEVTNSNQFRVGRPVHDNVGRLRRGADHAEAFRGASSVSEPQMQGQFGIQERIHFRYSLVNEASSGSRVA